MRQPLYPLSYTGKQVNGFEPSFSALATRHPDHWTTPAKDKAHPARKPCCSALRKTKNEQVLPARFAQFAAIVASLARRIAQSYAGTGYAEATGHRVMLAFPHGLLHLLGVEHRG
jgi:hypothetical protein